METRPTRKHVKSHRLCILVIKESDSLSSGRSKLQEQFVKILSLQRPVLSVCVVLQAAYKARSEEGQG